MNQVVRIIGGIYRGKKLHFPAVADLRPTPARVRETLFNWLMHSIRGAKCLDAFAGSGALGFEAFSRGAASVTLVEKSAQVTAYLKRQAQAFDTKQLRVVQADALLLLTNQTETFDIIFFDPPFALFSAIPSAVFNTLNQRLSPQGLLYLESPAPLSLNPNRWLTLKTKRAGQVTYSLMQKIPMAS